MIDEQMIAAVEPPAAVGAGSIVLRIVEQRQSIDALQEVAERGRLRHHEQLVWIDTHDAHPVKTLHRPPPSSFSDRIGSRAVARHSSHDLRRRQLAVAWTTAWTTSEQSVTSGTRLNAGIHQDPGALPAATPTGFEGG